MGGYVVINCEFVICFGVFFGVGDIDMGIVNLESVVDVSEIINIFKGGGVFIFGYVF